MDLAVNPRESTGELDWTNPQPIPEHKNSGCHCTKGEPRDVRHMFGGLAFILLQENKRVELVLESAADQGLRNQYNFLLNNFEQYKRQTFHYIYHCIFWIKRIISRFDNIEI